MCSRPAYLSVFDRIGMEISRSTDVQMHFSKYGERVYRKYGNHGVDKCKFVASEVDHLALVELLFVEIVYFKSFMGLKYMAGPDWSKKFLKQCTSTLHSKL